MNTFYEHHQDSIRFVYRCFDRILLNGLIQPFQQPERVVGFFSTYRNQYPVSRDLLRDIAGQYHNWVKNRSVTWDVPLLDAPPEARDRFVEPYFRHAKPDQVVAMPGFPLTLSVVQAAATGASSFLSRLEFESGAPTLPCTPTCSDHRPIEIDTLELVSSGKGFQVFVKGYVDVDRRRTGEWVNIKQDEIVRVCEVVYSLPPPQRPVGCPAGIHLTKGTTQVEAAYRRKWRAIPGGHDDDPSPDQGVMVSGG